MNKIRIYNDDEIKVLLKNFNVEKIKNKSQIVYKNSFKLWAVKEKELYPEKTAREIFIEGGFDMNILDSKTPQRRLYSWINKYKMFGKDYFDDKNEFTYKALSKIKDMTLSRISDDPNFIAFIIEKKDDGLFDYRIVRKIENEKNNS